MWPHKFTSDPENPLFQTNSSRHLPTGPELFWEAQHPVLSPREGKRRTDNWAVSTPSPPPNSDWGQRAICNVNSSLALAETKASHLEKPPMAACQPF